MEPKVLLFDEPLSNLDAKLREQMRVEIREIQKRLKITSVYVTHDQIEAMTLSDRIVVMNRGKIEQIGAPQEIYQRPATRFVADFIGKANFVSARVVDHVDGKIEVQTLGGQYCRVKCTEPVPPLGSNVTMVIRPEAITINRAGPIAGTIKRSSYLGSVVEYEVIIASDILQVTEHNPLHATLHPVGTSVNISLAEELLYVLPGSATKQTA